MATATAQDITTELPQTTDSNSISCSLFQELEQWMLPIDIVSLVSSLIALLATFLALFFIILFKRWTFLNQRLILYLCIATVVALVTNMLSRVNQRDFCVFAGFSTQIGGWMALNAYICITFMLMLSVFLPRRFKKPDIWVMALIFGSPFVFNWIPFINYSYGQSGILCWIKDTEMVNGTCRPFIFGQVLELVLWYIPLYLGLGIMIVLYIIILVKFYFQRKQWVQFDPNEDNERRYAINYVTSLLAYPVIYFIANVVPLIGRIYLLSNPTNIQPILLIIGIISYTQQGTGIAIVVLVSLRKKLTYPSLKAAMGDWSHRKATITEYPITEGEHDDDYDDKGHSESAAYKLYSEDNSVVL